jgi:DNA-binding transcriptional MerR regulator
MRSGELANQAGVSVDTLRHYEKKRLLAAPHRAPNGYREYPESALHRVRLIQRALDMGFSLDDLAAVLRQRDAGGAPCRQVRAIAAARLEELDARIEALRALRAELDVLLREWDDRLASLPAGQRAGLLDALAVTSVSASAPRPLRRSCIPSRPSSRTPRGAGR